MSRQLLNAAHRRTGGRPVTLLDVALLEIDKKIAEQHEEIRDAQRRLQYLEQQRQQLLDEQDAATKAARTSINPSGR